ncbi:uncharacterized protein MEPE_00081 [Melanopsichium pennsylvanicum]|uniref:Uncharacterized protein n=1 Tax=Melanopsichium pennsylvanicum TaxID=63383 RepID=A0AAJ5C2C2_9BASI|nr:uncharacterized protein MEPE_00081 [Melanopsichium pennsylvanicum]
MLPRVDTIALLDRTMTLIRTAHEDWSEDQVLEKAFSLININAPQEPREADKIPRSVISIISNITKLNENNWAIWEPKFIDCIQTIKNADEILTGAIPKDDAKYDEDLDRHLLGLILAACDNSPESRIDTYIVRKKGEGKQLGSTLYQKLKKALTINDEFELEAIHDRVHEVRLINRNVVNLGKELNQIWNDAARLGDNSLSDKLKKSTLYRCTRSDWLYQSTVDSLKEFSPGCSYEYAYHALAKKYKKAELEAQKVLHYLDQTQDICLRYGSRKGEEQLLAHSDANWASDPTTQRKSSSGSAVFVHGNLVAWKSALQRCTALSAVEAEFVAATEAAREILFFQQLFKAIGIDTGTPTILSDNAGTIQVSKDPQQNWKLKHIDTKYHFIRDNVQDGKINIKYINTADNLADIFTKPVGKESLRKERNGMGLIQPQTQRPSWPAISPVEGGS